MDKLTIDSNWQKHNLFFWCVCTVQPRQGESQDQAQPEDLRGEPEVKDEAVAGPVVWTGGHNPKKEHHREETAQADREVKQCGG